MKPVLKREYHTIIIANSDPPAWVPLPVAAVGTVSTPWGPDVIQIGEKPIDDVTQDYLVTGGAGPASDLFTMVEDASSGSLVEVSGELAQVMSDIAQQANRFLEAVTPGFPFVRLKLHPPADWLQGRFLSWMARDHPSGNEVPISSLSEAQLRWATLAIQLALWMRSTRAAQSAMLIDEPELALHAQLEGHVANELSDTARGGKLPIIVTSHSTSFLDVPDARLIHVYRGPDGVTRSQSMSETFRDGLDTALHKLGLSRSSGLLLIRLFVIVEGEHDRIVLEELFSDELGDLRVSILTMRGTKNAPSIIDSQLLARYSDASMLAVLDGDFDQSINQAWRRALKRARAGQVDEALRAFLRSTERNRKGGPDEAIVELGSAALENGRWPAFDLFRLSKPDIIYYLAPADLDDRLSDWTVIQDDYLKTRRPQEGIKEWLRRSRQVTISNRVVRRATRRLDEISPDLTKLMSKIEEAAKASRSTSIQRPMPED